MSNEVDNTTKGWDRIITAVRTPLGYAVFASLVGLVMLGIAIFRGENYKPILVRSSLTLIFSSIGYVFLMSAIKPEALRGERTKGALSLDGKFKDKLKKTTVNSIDDKCRQIGITKVGFFEDFTNSFPEKIEASETIRSMFIHSRRWRENNSAVIAQFLKKERSKITAFLPDFKNKELLSSIKKHFDDGDHLESFICDAFQYYSSLKEKFPEKIDIRCFNLYPTYSFYIFDDNAIIAMYNNTAKRRSVPTFEIVSESDFWNFLGDNLDAMFNTCKSLELKEIQEYAQLNFKKDG